nr:hypothetical protein [uncultured Flavobacterium sp.]
MKTNFLFPHSFKKIGWLLLIPTLLASVFFILSETEYDIFNFKVFAIYTDAIINKPEIFTVITNNLQDEMLGVLLIVGGILVAFSKEKTEDEFINKIRLESLVWATYVNYAILLLCLLLIYGMPFLSVMMYNMFTLLLFFIIRFHWMLYRNNKTTGDEE